MKVTSKLLIIALLLSIVFTISAVAAAENDTFEQSDMGEVSTETLSAPSGEVQEIEAVEDQSLVSSAEDKKEFLQFNNDTILNSGTYGTFEEVQSQIDGATEGSTIYLDGGVYIGTGKDITIKKNITIIGGSSSNPEEYATLNARGLSKILSTNSPALGKNVTITLKSIIFINGNNSRGVGAVDASSNMNIIDCQFINNIGHTGAFEADGSKSFYSGYYDSPSDEEEFYKIHGMYPDEYYSEDYTYNFINCTFKDNHADYYGGALRIFYHMRDNNPVGIFNNCWFINNSAVKDGGAIDGSTSLVSNCYFINNYAEEGGATYFAIVENSYFINNSAVKGGATYYGEIINSYFINNSADKGGAVYCSKVSNSKFENNSAGVGGAIYTISSDKYYSNEFTNNIASDSSSAVYVGYSVVEFKGNKINSNKSEIFVAGRLDGFNVIILDNGKATFCEGRIKIYALVIDDQGNKITKSSFTFLVGDKEFTTKVVEGIAEIEYDANLSDDGIIVNYKTTQYDKPTVFPCRLSIIPFGVKINFNDVTGYPGEIIHVPVSVHDTANRPLEGKISIVYNNNRYIMTLENGKCNVPITLPNELTSFDLSIQYQDYSVKHDVTVIQKPSVVPIIDIANNMTGIAGKTITIPVKVHDEDDNPLSGDLYVTFNGGSHTVTLLNGQADVLIGLPVYDTLLEVTVIYKGKSASCLITVVNEINETKSIITMPNYLSGNINATLIIPVSVKDDKNNPLTGNVTFYYNGQKDNRVLNNGETNIVIILPNYETTKELIVDYKGNVATCFIEAIDPTNHTDVIIEVPNNISGGIGEKIDLSINVTNSKGESLNGEMLVSYLGKELKINLEDGKANIVINLPKVKSSFDITLSYNGHIAICLVNVIDSKPHNDTVPVIDLDEYKHVEIGRSIIIPVDIHDGEGNPLEGEIFVYYNNQEKTYSLDNKGHFNIVIPSQTTPAYFEVTVYYNGIMKHCMVNVTDNQPIKPGIIISIPQNETGHVGNTLVIPVIVKDENGKNLEGEIHAFYNGHEKTETLHNGHANIIMELPNAPTSYNLMVSYKGIEKVCFITVIDKDNNNKTNDTSIIIELNSKINGHVGKNIQIPIFVHDGHNPLEGEIFVIYHDKIEQITLNNGMANVLVGLPIHESTFEFTVYYEGIKKISTVHVIDPSNPLGNQSNIESDGDGNLVIDFPDDATGEVIVNIAGKNYTGKIVDGKVELDVKDLPNGNYESIVYYDGDGNYSGFSKTIMIVVKESTVNNNQNTPVNKPVVKKASKITAKKKTFKKSLKVKKYSITLKSGKTPIKKVQVTIKVGKKTYKAKTNAKGKATFKIKKLSKKGKYNAVVKFKGNKNYKATSKKVKITVK